LSTSRALFALFVGLCALSIPTSQANAFAPASLPHLITHLHPYLAQIRDARAQHQPSLIMKIKLIYAHNSDEKRIDPDLRDDLPSLGMYDFDSYKLLNSSKQLTPYQTLLPIPISQRYKINIRPKSFDEKEKKISIHADFLHRKNDKKDYRSYASMVFRLQNGGKIAIVGPSYLHGRALLILSARHQP
jgi:hypothetical protein